MPKSSKVAVAVALGRTTTDRSLGAERAKTDESFAARLSALGDNSERSSRKRRTRADKDLADARVAADAATTVDRSTPSVSRSTERRKSDARLKLERTTVDREMRAERTSADSSRRQHEAFLASAEVLFRNERRSTDKDLARERDHSDGATRLAAASLSNEVSAHAHARVALALRDDFLALLSMELRAPMQAISVAADRLNQSVFRAANPRDTRAEAEIIARHSHEVLRLMGDLLERVALWNPPDPRVRRPDRKGGTATATKRPPGRR